MLLCTNLRRCINIHSLCTDIWLYMQHTTCLFHMRLCRSASFPIYVCLDPACVLTRVLKVTLCSGGNDTTRLGTQPIPDGRQVMSTESHAKFYHCTSEPTKLIFSASVWALLCQYDFIYSVYHDFCRMPCNAYQQKDIWSNVRRFIQQHNKRSHDQAQKRVWIAMCKEMVWFWAWLSCP